MSNFTDEQIEQIRQNNDVVSIIGNIVPLTRRGSSYVGSCPFHNDTSPSFTVDPSKQLWHCFGCKAGGDVIEFVQQINSVTFPQAINILSNGSVGVPSLPPHQRERLKKTTIATSVPNNVSPPDEHPKLGKPDHRWTYRLPDGRIAGYIDRYNNDGNKEIRPLVWGQKEGEDPGWLWNQMPTPRPLYNADRLTGEPELPVMIVEGEKTADAVQRLCPEVVVTTWPGGGSAVTRADWSILKERNVLLWPDADEPGKHAMVGHIQRGRIIPGVAQELEDITPNVLVVDPPPGVVKGWDLADAEAEGWTKRQIYDHIKSSKNKPPNLAQPQARTTQQVNTQPSLPFKPLGYDHEKYYFLPNITQQIAELTPPALTRPNLLRLADLDYWEANYPSKQGVRWSDAAADLMELCHSVGPYWPGRIRGRGAWVDGKDSVLHLGDRLMVNGVDTAFHAHKGVYVYERSGPLETAMVATPATVSDAMKYGQLFDRLHWKDPSSAFLVTGFAFLAPICGALRWRPHVFITGPRGCGKTWVLQEMVAPLLGPGALIVEGSTTEAGIRQTMRADALPVIFDELDQQAGRRHDSSRIQGIFELARLASSENVGKQVKGSGSGDAIAFRCRSMFLFGAINAEIKRAADASRISVLELEPPPKNADSNSHFRRLENDVAHLLTDDYLASLRSRAYHMIPIIRESAKVLADVIARELGEQRLGDQLGGLLAGAHCVLSDYVITEAQAKNMVTQINLDDAKESQEINDEMTCLNTIMQQTIRVEVDRGAITRSISELLCIATHRLSDLAITGSDADDTLRRHGVRAVNSTHPDHFCISNNHESLKRMLERTPYNETWAGLLARLPGSEKVGTRNFACFRQRAVMIPFDLMGDPHAD